MRLLKPNPEIYLQALSRSGCKADESLFIDDSQRNVDGAAAVGMHAVRFNPQTDDLRAVVTKALAL